MILTASHAPPRQPDATGRVDRVLRWSLLVTVLVGVAVLVYGTVAAWSGRPPIPDRVVAPDGTVVYTGRDVVAGKAVFQRTDLMDFGSLSGNGAYFGPDWGDDYLHRQLELLRGTLALQRFGASYERLAGRSDHRDHHQQPEAPEGPGEQSGGPP